MAETQGSKTISTKLERIAEIAKRMPGVALTSLSHHIDMDWIGNGHRIIVESRRAHAPR